MLAIPLFAAAAVFGCVNARAVARGYEPFEACVANAVGNNAQQYALPTGVNYTTSLNVYNLDHIYIPSAVAWPTCKDQVAELVKCAAAAGVAVQAQAGGHSYLVSFPHSAVQKWD